MADQTIPDYETISAAVTGETWAVEKVLMAPIRISFIHSLIASSMLSIGYPP